MHPQLKNAFFTLQGDYTNNRFTYEDEDHGTNLFNYGYVGKFKTYKAPIYQSGTAVDSLTSTIYTGQVLSGWADTLFTFEAGDLNPNLVNYTNAYYDLFEEYGQNSFQSSTMSLFGIDASNDGIIRTAADLKGQGLLNGDSPASVYSLYGNHGSWYGYSVKQEILSLVLKLLVLLILNLMKFLSDLNLNKEKIIIGNLMLLDLWSLMRQQANKHILERDLANPNPVYDANGIYQDTVNYDRLFVSEEQSTFDRNLVKFLGT